MKDISELKRKYFLQIAKKSCHVDHLDKCPKGDHCTCAVAAELEAFLHTIIPSGYSKLGVDDFNGKCRGERLISNELAISVKKKIVEFCWGVDLEKFNNMSVKDRTDKSIMCKRLESGNNVVIYSDNNTKGKTFTASLLMKEAIKQRIRPGNSMHTYDWLTFSMIEYNMRKNEPVLNHSRSANWVVVDDITSSVQSRNADAYISSMVNPFFYDRLQDKLPTIFVFRFNIYDTAWNVEEKYGIAVRKIIEDPNTFKISLCESI